MGYAESERSLFGLDNVYYVLKFSIFIKVDDFMRTVLITTFFLLIGHSYFGKNRTFLNWLDTM